MRRTCAFMIAIFGAAAFIALIGSCASAQSLVTAKPMEISMFKNGFGFVIREFTVPAAGEYLLKDLPIPAHGTFWILSEQEGSAVKEAVALSSPRSDTIAATTLPELLRANVGKRVEIKTEADGWTAGTILETPERTPKLPVKMRRDGGYYDGYSSRAYQPPSAKPETQTPQFVLLKTDKGVLALACSEIKGVRGAGGDLATAVPEKTPGAALRMRVTGGGGRFQVAYLAWGITWAPSYRIELSKSGQAALACKAEVLNDTEEIDGTRVNCVAGYPNLAYSEAISPLAMIGDVSDFMQSLMSLGVRRGIAPAASNVMAQMAGPASPGMPTSRPVVAEEGQVREDLFLYPLANVTLQPGERGYYQLFTRQVPYEDIYQWEIGDSLDEQGRWRYGSWYGGYGDVRNREPEQEEIWHSLRLTNSGDTPWTTGPAMIVQQGSILGQDTLYYTSAGQKTMLKVTRSMEIGAEKTEKEVERQRNAVTAYDGTNWDLVTVAGELRIRNNKAQGVKLLVKKTLSGEVLESSPKAAVETTTAGVWRLNQQQLVTWEVPVAAKGRATLSYRYRVYARR